MMGSIKQPALVVLNTEDIYKEIHSKLFSLLGNVADIKEIFNQAVDYVTDDENLHYVIGNGVNINMLRCKQIDKNDLEKIALLANVFSQLCKELQHCLLDIRAKPVIDMTTAREIYPYYFYNLVKGSVVLKRM